jgi:very-short-patch-repair endonuclease
MSERFTTEFFIKRARLVHGDRYDYSKINYINKETKGIITCPKEGHGDFLQRLGSHLRGCGCPNCAKKIRISKKTYTNDKFVQKSSELHKGFYSYKKTKYINSQTLVTITCPNHGDFEQIPASHLQGKGCNYCAIEQRANNSRMKNEEFIILGNKKFNHKFDYTDVNMVNCDTPVTIGCPEHGKFLVTPYNHLNSKHGCISCGNKNSAKMKLSDTPTFIKNAIAMHGYKYDYSLVDYINSKTPIKIKCKIHGIFKQLPSAHLYGLGCLECSGKMKLTKEKFTERAREKFDIKFDYTYVNMVNCDTPVTIGCPEHGKFLMTPYNHLNSKHGCLACSGVIKSNTEKFIKKSVEIHVDKYDYSLVDYKTNREYVKILCKKHGIFKITPHNHLIGQGCPRCINKTEGRLFLILKESFPYYTIIHQNPIVGKGRNSLKIDFHIVEFNLYIELDGDQHFRQVSSWDPPEKTQAHDLTKTMRVLKKGQSLVRIYQPWVASDTNNWLEKLKENIREYEKPTLVFIGPEGIYDKHKEDLRYSSLSNNLYETSMFS